MFVGWTEVDVDVPVGFVPFTAVVDEPWRMICEETDM